MTVLILSQRLEDCWWDLGPYCILCSGLCPGTRAHSVVCHGSCDQCGLSGVCVLLGKYSLDEAGAQVSGMVEVGLPDIQK